MHFTRLRLSGFKSFVDPTELLIEPGLTGVVGPNGCGKSNLLEALRWVMGENSAKSMRGTGMDDVIFAGTTNRPARNLAEVTLYIDNTERRAPAAFNDEIFLEVTRRIERQSGSAYRINGRDVRARDVHLLFADMATGAHSPALVSQGRVGALINAKPRDRRALLEEAAGISGLQSRRDEAERRLKASEANLLRLDDVMGQIETQVQSLRRQARQAARYRELSQAIRRHEAMLYYLEWRLAAEKLMETERSLREIELKLAEIAGDEARISARQSQLAAELPRLRQAEAERAAALHRLAVARDGLVREERNVAEATMRLTQQLSQIEADIKREASLVEDARNATERLEAERFELEAASEGEADAQAAAAAAVEAASRAASAREAALDQLRQKRAALAAEQNRLQQAVNAAEARLLRLRRDREGMEARIRDVAASPDVAALEQEQEAIFAIEARVESLAGAADEAREATEAAREDERRKREILEARRTELTRIESERDALRRMLASAKTEGATPVADLMKVRAGFEAALGAALGDDLDAPLDEEAPLHWRDLPPLGDAPALPAGAEPLAQYVDAPPALARRLSQVGVVDAATAAELQSALRPGQRLVSREGDLWRWDGLVASADAPTAAAVRLAQRNRLDELDALAESAQEAVDSAAYELEQAAARARDAASRERETQQAHRNAESDLNAARKKLAELERRAAQAHAQRAALQEAIARLDRDIEEVTAERDEAAESLAMLAPADDLEAEIEAAKAEVETLRLRLAAARAEHDTIAAQARHRRERLQHILQELAAWTNRLGNAERQDRALAERRAQVTEELAVLAERPAELAEDRERLNQEIAIAEEARREAADALAAQEAAVAEANQEARRINAALMEARELRARAEANLEQIMERRRAAAQRIAEEFECNPADVPEKMDLPADLPTIEEVEGDLHDLKRERDRLGAVNLRADVELQEYEAQFDNLFKERTDLEEAIARLRQAIHSLNREGRERLLAAFTEVNTHFSTLFRTLFGGGEAHLTLTEAEDPLEAGLEIMASPPGKKLQSLSLLSGGEQALTALSLIFAVFVTNPAPICVLDEVDAPLDDANVERFCNMLDEMVQRTATRFLVVTHNAVTMSRMNRLFGVTMAERGVSQLVSVDLERAEQLRAVG